MGLDSVINKYQVSWLVFIGDSLTDVDSDWTLIVCSLRAFFNLNSILLTPKGPKTIAYVAVKMSLA